MGRKKREKRKKKRQAERPAGTVPDNTAEKANRPEPTDLGHLSGEWREFYRLVIGRLNG